MSVNYGYIYKTTNTINGKIYIGKKHGKFNSDYLGSGLIIKRAIKKHGKEIFNLELICKLETSKQLDEFERFLIKKYREILGKNNIYNITDGGEGGDTFSNNPNKEEIRKKCSKIHLGNQGMLGKHHTEEARRRIGQAQKGRVVSQKTREKLSKANSGRGRKQSEETKLKISNTLIGIKRPSFTETHRNNLSKSHTGLRHPNRKKGYTLSDSTKNKMSLGYSKHKIDCICCSCKSHRNKMVKNFC